MNLILKCKCGSKLRVTMEQVGTIVACPGCNKSFKVPAPRVSAPPAPVVPPPAPAAAAMESSGGIFDEEVKLQELKYPEPRPAEEEVRLQETPAAAPKPQESEDDDAGYGLDANDGLADLGVGTGLYATIAVINLDEPAPCIAYGCKGDWALAGQGDNVLILNMKTKKKVAHFEEHESEVTSVALSATAPLALSGDDDGIIRFWDIASLKRKKKIAAHDGTVNAVALSPDGKLAASGGADSMIQLWDLDTGKRMHLDYNDWDEWEEEVTYVGFSRDGAKLLAGGSGGRISIWSVDTGKRKRFAGLDLPISCVRLSDEGGKVTATTHPIEHRGVSYLVLCHWETATGKPLSQFNLAVETIPCCIAPDRGGTRAILGGGGADPWMGVWSLENGHCLHIYDQLRGSPLCLAVAPLSNRLLAALHNKKLQLFGLEPF